MLIHTDRVKADRPYFSGKHRVHGMNVQVLATPDGTVLWTSGALPERLSIGGDSDRLGRESMSLRNSSAAGLAVRRQVRSAG